MNERVLNDLQTYGQTHLVQWCKTLAPADAAQLEKQLENIDFEMLSSLIKSHVLQQPQAPSYANLAPANFFPVAPRNDGQKELYVQAELLGKEMLKQGKVAFLTVAGGQGSRLGFDGPKGTYPITPIGHKTLCEYFALTIKRLCEKYGAMMRWYIMTSRLNDTQTRAFFAEHHNFGLAADQIFFFTQGTMPAIDYDGHLLLGAKDALALAPDGHGGTLLALRKSGALEQMQRDHVEYLSYFQVDNPLVQMGDPLFIGLHVLEHSQFSSRSLSKVQPYEKLGNFCMVDGKLHVIEYSDMPAELAEARHEDGTLCFLAGSPAIHIISRTFVEELTQGGKLSLPWHRADKKVPFINLQNGELCKPEQNNAVKLESFIFDALPLARKTLILEGIREEQFAPTKNATGVDSAESCREMLLARDRKRLEDAGVTVPEGARVEISPCCCVDQDDVNAYVQRADFVPPGQGDTLYA